MIQHVLENAELIEDLRLDSNQISFAEYDEDLDPRGDINLVEIFMRYYQDDPEQYQKYRNAIDALLKQKEEAKLQEQKEPA